MSETAAVAFGLDRPVLTGACTALRTLPAAVQECVIGSGALGLLKGEAKHAAGQWALKPLIAGEERALHDGVQRVQPL